MTTGMPTPRQIVERYLDAVAAFEYDAARECLADDGFEYIGPINSFTSADRLVRYLELATPIVQRIEIRKVFSDGGDVAHFLLVSTQLSEKFSVHVAQWAHVSGGRIARLQVVFDAQWYRALFPDGEDRG